MANWKNRLDLHDVFRVEDMPFTAKRDIVVDRIRKASFFDEDDMQLVDAVNEITVAVNEEEFDEGWDSFYDWCDMDHRVWVEVF